MLDEAPPYKKGGAFLFLYCLLNKTFVKNFTKP